MRCAGVWVVAGVLLCGGCADEDEEGPIVEAGVVECDENTPLITWDTFAEGFMTTHCQGCHASTSIDRKGAPTQIVFDTEADALLWKATIVDVATSDEPRMPPAGGPGDDDRAKLRIWLMCFAAD